MEIYSIIGFIANYAGGANLKNGIIQVIPIAEDQEGKMVNFFEETCKKFFEERNQISDLNVIKEQELTRFESIQICHAIKKLSQLDFFLGRDYLMLNENIFDVVPYKNYYNRDETGNQQRLAFLRGALIRHTRNGIAYFYNDYEKALLVHRILSKFADEEDEIIMQSAFLIPHTISIEIRKQNSKKTR